MGQQDDLCAGCLCGAQGLHHVAGRARIRNEEHDILRRHQAGGEKLQVAVSCRAELVGQAGKAGTDIIGQQHAAALPQAEHLPCCPQQIHGLVHRIRRKGALGAIDGREEQRARMLTELVGGRARLRLLLIDERSGRIGLGQRNAHLMISIEPQRPAEPENSRLGHLALPRQRRDRKILRLVGMVDEVIRHHPPGFGQLVLPLVQQLPEISRHVSFLSYFFPRHPRLLRRTYRCDAFAGTLS